MVLLNSEYRGDEHSLLFHMHVSVRFLVPQGGERPYRTLEGGRPAEQAASAACLGWHSHLLRTGRLKKKKKKEGTSGERKGDR